MRLRGVMAACLCAGMAAGLLHGSRTLAQESAAPKSAQLKAVKLGKLWDGKGKVWTNAIVIVEGERVREVTTDAKRIPPGATVIDLSKYYGMPGMIDVHTHMTIYTDETPGTPMLKQVTSNSPVVQVFLARKGAMRVLEAGVTTVRDLGADQYEDIAMRDLINRGEMLGPRMFVAGVRTEYYPDSDWEERGSRCGYGCCRRRAGSFARGAAASRGGSRRDQNVRVNGHGRRYDRI